MTHFHLWPVRYTVYRETAVHMAREAAAMRKMSHVMFNGSRAHQLIAEETTQLLMRAESTANDGVALPTTDDSWRVHWDRDATRYDRDDKRILSNAVAPFRDHSVYVNSYIKTK